MQYTAKKLHSALELYKEIINTYPDANEAKYARSQVKNITNTVVPKQILFDTQLELALAHAKQ